MTTTLIQPANFKLRASGLGLDERREVYFLLSRMSEKDRTSYLQWCCNIVARRMKTPVKVNPKSGTPGEAYNDLMMLAECHKLDLDEPLRELVRRAKNFRFGRR